MSFCWSQLIRARSVAARAGAVATPSAVRTSRTANRMRGCAIGHPTQRRREIFRGGCELRRAAQAEPGLEVRQTRPRPLALDVRALQALERLVEAAFADGCRTVGLGGRPGLGLQPPRGLLQPRDDR